MTNKKCLSCEGSYPEDECYKVKDGFVCETCRDEAEPIATVIYSDDRGNLSLDEKETGSKDIITEYENDTDFLIEWKSSNAWRGYYEIIKSGSWVNVHEDCILAYSEDSHNLKDFDDQLEEFCNKNSIAFIKVFCRTSNVFSTGYDFFVEKKNKSKIQDFLKKQTIREVQI